MNPYYNPEELGLEVVTYLEDPGACYDFDMFAIWFHPEQKVFYYAQDSGCSCPSPFEDYTSLESLTKLDPENVQDYLDFLKDLEEFCSYRDPELLKADKLQAVVKVYNKITELRREA